MKCVTVISAFCFLFYAVGQTLTWDASPSATSNFCYVVYGGTISRNYAYAANAGTNTSLTWTYPLTPGTNYFTVALLQLNGVDLQMSDWSTETYVTYQTGTVLESVVLTTTNLDGQWTPFVTNQFALHMNEPRRFFKPGPLALVQTNGLVYPPMP